MFDSQAIDLKKEIEKLEKLSVKERGVGIKYLNDYLFYKKGKNGLEKAKRELNKVGYKLPDIDKIDNLDWISSSVTIIYFLAAAKVFNFSENDILEIGRDAAISPSTLAKFFIKYFLSLERTIKKAAAQWKNLYSEGEVIIKEINKKKKVIIIQLKNICRHPAVCIYNKGVFSRIAEIATGWKNLKVEETKCCFSNDKYHEFVITGK